MERRPTWQIANDIANAFDSETGEIDVSAVDTLTGELADKAEAVHHVIRAWDAEVEAIKAERERLATRGAQIEARAERLRLYLLACMQAAGTRKLSTALVTCSIRAGSERVEIAADVDLPPEYVRTAIVPDKAEIKRALKAGKHVEGCALVIGAETIGFR